ncbi:hypothetical protein HYPSUDRAFT_71889 [Hypholoma sublateritium FD-334 SS-4]|uniref:Uncharacterized protein n=1 Tax=Hypholoma sublateritium (strain FD-334 SS-4) TaxID=945553 RepID=A0A0D2LXL6_HYPSF|nr:hypothetical protein HYPSUDRAFT_71889 [Hypholoma sublateritium FD-334 SS-4]
MSDSTTAIYPLTLFDGPNGEAGLFIGWLVEGIIDIQRMEARMRNLIVKWPLLAGRIEQISKWESNIIVPLGEYPEGHSTFRLTSTASESPITTYTSLPVPTVSTPLPRTLFMQPDHPIIARDWVARDLPLLHWHLTFFEHPGQEYTCIGLVLPHLLVDGPGCGVLLRRIESEMLNQAWEVPPPLHAGKNENPLRQYIEGVQNDIGSGKSTLRLPSPIEYPTITLGGISFLFKYLFWHVWQRLRHRSFSQLIRIPHKVVQKLVDDTNKVADVTGDAGEATLSMVDIMTAWIYKTVYSREASLGCRTNLVNMDYSRVAPGLTKENYIHNCFTPVQYPVLTVAELKATALRALALQIAHAKAQYSLARSIYTYELLHAATQGTLFRGMFPRDGVNADEAMTISNMTAANLGKLDWSGVGGRRTVSAGQGVLVHIPVLMANVVVIGGEGEDGCLSLHATLGARRMKALTDGLLRLVKDAEMTG